MKSGLAKSLGSLCANVEAMTPGAIAGLTICNEGWKLARLTCATYKRSSAALRPSRARAMVALS